MPFDSFCGDFSYFSWVLATLVTMNLQNTCCWLLTPVIKTIFVKSMQNWIQFLGKCLLEACHLTKNKFLQKLFLKILWKFQPSSCKFLIDLTVSICCNTLLQRLFLFLTQIISPVFIVRNYFFKKLVLMI